MKVTYLEQVENRIAFSRNMYCTCGSHEYEIVKVLEPYMDAPWFIRCPECGREIALSPTKEIAKERWKLPDEQD